MAEQREELTFEQWMEELAEVSRKIVAAFAEPWDEELRHDYYEGQSDTWRDSWEDGLTPQEAIESDMSYWEP
jgi:hypothetical protein